MWLYKEVRAEPSGTIKISIKPWTSSQISTTDGTDHHSTSLYIEYSFTVISIKNTLYS